MEIEFDPKKDAENIRKHGVSLSLASELDWENALVWVDDRYEYNEYRLIALAPKTSTLYYVAFVDRDQGDETNRSVISLRQATHREVNYYVKNS